jgi:hypothetical protein
MKKDSAWIWIVSFVFIGASILTYAIHYLIFRDLKHIFKYAIGDVAFLFLDVWLVVLLIERLLALREKKAMLKKLNMVIGTFFSEVGFELLKKCSIFLENATTLEDELKIKSNWGKKDFQNARMAAKSFSYQIRFEPSQLADLNEFLSSKRSFLLRLLENPNLLEHERFTDLLWAVFHLAEELAFRGNELDKIPEKDSQHIAGDLKRAYNQLISEWISYTQHLQESYPFLFSLAVRINPLDPQSSPIVS